MAWPDKEQIIKAMLDESNYIDPAIHDKYKCKLRPGIRRSQGMVPDSASGGFAVSFKMIAKSGSLPQIYYRVFCRELNESMGRRQKRINLIQSYITSHSALSSYFVDFAFVPRAIYVGGDAIPGMRMQNVEGLTLGEFLMDCLKRRSSDELAIKHDFASLAKQFYIMISCMESLGVAHGDLSCDNIIITPEKRIKLIDYDSIYVPTMKSDFYQTTPGSVFFQHPERSVNKNSVASKKDDYFSDILIYLFLRALSFDLSLLDEAGTDDDESTSQFIDKSYLDSEQAFVTSPAYQIINRIKDDSVSELLYLMRKAIAGRLADVPSLLEYYNIHQKYAPKIAAHFSRVEYCVNCGHKFINADDLYCTQCGAKRLQYQEQSDTSYGVNLVNSGAARLWVIKVVKELLNIGLREAKELVDKTPIIIKSGLTKQNAQEIIRELKEAGADATLVS